ncbi:MAG: transporter substrate-binding domain-containing protein [Spirochaetaceae bacterium]|nr:transporter substrate-binding domain-containing protein [Spirochaetaceae bacterium]
MKKNILIHMLEIKKGLLIILLICFLPLNISSLEWLNREQNDWLDEHRQMTLTLGFDPQAGMEYFDLHGEEYGFIIELAELLSESLGIPVIPDKDKNWGEAYKGLQNGEIDILFGANETAERKETMIFTDALYKIPYSLLAQEDNDIYVVGDLEERKTGFIEGDVIISLFPQFYKRINYKPVIFHGQNDALDALGKGEIEAFITSGGIVIYDYLKDFPGIKEIKTLDNFTSDMTLSVQKKNIVLASIINKFITEKEIELKQKVSTANYLYNYKVMDLTKDEVDWIMNEGKATVGVAEGYLPFEYLKNGVFKGINAAILREITHLTNIEITPVSGEFESLFNEAMKGNINIMNIAKTVDRLEYFNYTQPFSEERDEIYGHRDSPLVEDIYGLSHKRVAVVKGYWHRELLKKNAIDAEILITDSLKESMTAILRNKADYMIENKSVMRYFIEEWEMYDLSMKGLTSYNSLLYFGVSKNKPELVSIMNKAMHMIDLKKTVNDGYNEIPHHSSKNQILIQLIFIVLLIVGLIALGLYAYFQAKALIESRMTEERMKEREELMYRDPMTQLYNRHFLYHKVEPFISKWSFPQTVIICDLNNLKTTNDKWGHAVGDRLLKTFAIVLKENFDRDDILIRMGGDEFLIIVTGKTEDRALKSARGMEDSFKNHPIRISDDLSIFPSTAWGLATRYHNSDISFENLQIEADNKMYLHKKEMKL